MKWITNAPIVRRLLIASVFVAIFPGVVLAFLGFYYINSLNARGQAVQASTDGVKLVAARLADLQHMNADVLALHAARVATASGYDPEVPIAQMEQTLNNEISTLSTQFSQGLDTYQRDYLFASSPNVSSVRDLIGGTADFKQMTANQQSTLRKIIDEQWPQYVHAQNQELQAISDNKPATQLATFLQDVDDKYKPLEQSWQSIVNLTEEVSDQVATADEAQAAATWPWIILAIVVIVAVVVTVGYVINLTIARPLRRLALLTRRISSGETNARASAGGSDEISLVAASINIMLDKIVLLIRDVQAQRDELQRQIEKLVGEVSTLGEGNLLVQAEVTATPLGAVAESFNYMIKELSSLVVRVTRAANEVEHSTALIFELLSRMVQAGDVQLGQIAEATGEVERMADFSRQVAERARALTSAAHDAHNIVQKGRVAVQRASEGMKRIHSNVQETSGKVQMLGEHSREITSIVRVIENIAQQTNHLAFEASAQAALVGENGKGFSAVAADIQRLSERTRGQVSSINRIVSSVHDYVRQTASALGETERKSAAGIKLTMDAGTSLEAIFTSVENQASEVANIDHMTTQQIQGFSAIAQTMHHISASTQKINVSTREAAQTIERLAWIVSELSASVKVFKLHDSQKFLSSPDGSRERTSEMRQPLGLPRNISQSNGWVPINHS